MTQRMFDFVPSWLPRISPGADHVLDRLDIREPVEFPLALRSAFDAAPDQQSCLHSIPPDLMPELPPGVGLTEDSRWWNQPRHRMTAVQAATLDDF
jgi:hypothetical protein